MTHMKYGVAMLAAFLLIVGATPSAAQNRDEPTVGSMVTLNTCIERSPTNSNKFLLTNIVDVPAHPPTKGGRVVYWISKIDNLKPHVGHHVRLTGKITDVDKEEMEVKLGEAPDGSTIVEIEGPGRQVKGTPAQTGVSAAGQTVKERDIPTTLVKVKVSELSMISASCPAAAVASAASETYVAREETTVETARAEVDRSSEVARAAAAEVAVETPAPAVSVERTETYTMPEPTTTTAARTTRRTLPKTATPLPLFGLLGLGSLVGAAALRLRRR